MHSPKKAVVIVLFLLTSLSLYGQKLTNERAEWFTNARFGMFIHWGIYSGTEGVWKGEKLRHDNDYAEWICYRNTIEREEYLTLLDRFDWNEIDPEEWVVLAKKAGMKYATITAKHHDGFGLWDSQVSEYDVANYTNPKRDIIDELAKACQKHGVKLCLYYSHWVDWDHPYGWDHSREVYGITNAEYDQYWQEKVIPQMRELLTHYGDISMIWFDMWVHHSKSVVSKEQLLQLKSLIRELQPDCLVNSRLGLSIEEDSDIDFKTMRDNELGSKKEDFPWQTSATVAHSWGVSSYDTQWKSTTALLRALISNVSLNGNLMLNIGPRANGDIPFEIEQRILEMGRWMEVHGDSIYHAEAFDLNKDLHDWGKITCKKTDQGFNLYLHVFNWPLSDALDLTGISEQPDRVYVLSDRFQTPLSYTHAAVLTAIELPAMQPDPYASVIVLEYNQKPGMEEGLVAKTSDGGYSLLPQNQYPVDESLILQPSERRGTVPPFIRVTSDNVFKWKIYVDRPGVKNLDISYSFQNETSDSEISIQVAGTKLTHTIQPTGKTVGEANLDWAIDRFSSHRVGAVEFPSPGFYELELKIEPAQNEEVKFQWMWVK